MARVSLRRNIHAGRVIGLIITLVLVLWVGQEVMGTVADTLFDVNSDWNAATVNGGTCFERCNSGGVFANDTNMCGWCDNDTYMDMDSSYFETAFRFLGIGSFQSGGIIAVIGIIAVAALALQFIRIRF